MNDRVSHYDVLGVAPTASADEVHAAYRRAARRCHPDAGGSAEAFEEVAAAYRVLGDTDRRRSYDRARSASPPGQFHPPGPHHAGRPAPAPQAGNPPAGREHRWAGEDSRVRRAYLAMMVVAVSLFIAAGTVVRLFSVPAAFGLMVVAMLIPPAAAIFANRPHSRG